MRQLFPEVVLKSGAEKQEVAGEKVESREGFLLCFSLKAVMVHLNAAGKSLEENPS